MKIQNQSGIILVEALLAVVILGVGISLVVQSLNVSRRNVARSLDYTRAIFSIENKLTEMLLSPSSSLSLDADESLQDAGQEYAFNLKEKSLARENVNHLKDVEANLSWKTGHRENVLSVSTLVFDPSSEKQD